MRDKILMKLQICAGDTIYLDAEIQGTGLLDGRVPIHVALVNDNEDVIAQYDTEWGEDGEWRLPDMAMTEGWQHLEFRHLLGLLVRMGDAAQVFLDAHPALAVEESRNAIRRQSQENFEQLRIELLALLSAARRENASGADDSN